MNTEAIWESLTENGEFVVHIEDSKWKEHKIYDPDEALFDYKENELILTTVFNNNIFEDAQRIAIKNYLTHENTFYSMFIEKFLESQFVFDAWLGYDIEPYLKANDIKIPDEISLEWLKNNVKLIAININNEKDGYAFLEFDFAVSWDDEHGLRALVYKDSILAFAEGGICWSDDLDDYTERSSEVEEKAHILKDKLDEYKAIKKQRNATDDAMEKLLAYPNVKKETIDEELLSSLEGNWYEEFIYIEGDLVLHGDLDIDALHSRTDGLIINGNLKVNGGIYNLEGDYGRALVVSGDVVADYLVGGGSEIYLLGHTQIYSFVVGHYNHGILQVNDINAVVEVNSDHHCQIYGEIAYHFDDYNFSYDELGKIYGDEKSFIEIEYDEDEKYYSLDIDGFNNALLQGDEVLLEELLEHFLEREKVLKSLKTAQINNDELEIIKTEEILEKYVCTSKTDAYEYDDWDDEDDEWEEEGSESAHRFKLYDLTEIEALNNEIDESGIVSNTWWKNIKLFLSKEGIQTIGLLATKIKYITTSSLQDIDLKDRDDTLTELEKFSLILHHFYKKEESIRQVLLAFIFLLLWFYPQSIILYIFLAYYAYKWYRKYINFSKHIQWIERAKAYTKHVTIDSESTEGEVTNSLDDTLTFIRYTTEQDKENWSVKLFDFIVNLFKGKR